MTDWCTCFPDTIWWLPGKAVSIAHICYDHDAAYIASDEVAWWSARLKWQSDFTLAAEVMQLSYRESNWCRKAIIVGTGIAMFSAVSTIGWPVWLVGTIRRGYEWNQHSGRSGVSSPPTLQS